MVDRAVHPAAGGVSCQLPEVAELLLAGLSRARRSWRAKVVAFHAAAGELHRPGGHVPAGGSMASAKWSGMCRWGCSLSCSSHGEDLTQLPYLERRARLRGDHPGAAAGLTTASEGSTRPAPDDALEQAVTTAARGRRASRRARTPGDRVPRRLAVDRAEARLPHRAVRHRRPGRGRRVRRARPARAGSTARCRWPPTRGRRGVPTRRSAAPGSPTLTWPAAGTAVAAGPRRTAGPGGRPPAPDAWSSRAGAGDLSAELSLAQLHRRPGSDPGRRRAGHALPALHRPVARPQGRHHATAP